MSDVGKFQYEYSTNEYSMSANLAIWSSAWLLPWNCTEPRIMVTHVNLAEERERWIKVVRQRCINILDFLNYWIYQI